MRTRSTRRILFVHWNEAEAKERSRKLVNADVDIASDPRGAASLMATLKRRRPDAIVIDLSRLPSQGRDLALALRESRATRSIPVVFVGGEPEKVAKLEKLLPDATYASWRGIRGALRRATSNPPVDAVVRNRMSGYAHKTLASKLGVRDGMGVAMPGAPKGFEKKLGVPRSRGARDLTLWFVTSQSELVERMDEMKRYAENGGLWIVWPKKSGPKGGDLDPAAVRRAAEREGLVDYKIASIDDVWSGLKFTRKKGH